MQLHKAITRVAKVAAKGKSSPTLYQTVRLVPAEGTLPNRVFSTDGLVTSTIPVDLDIPDVLLPVDAMKKVAAHEITEVEEKEGYARFRIKAGGRYRIKILDPRGYPFPPAPPYDLIELDYWPWIEQVIHATPDAKGNSGFKVVRFGPDWVGCTDEVRVAVADVPGWREPHLIPSALFKSCPKGKVEAAITKTHSYFQWGEELRSAPTKSAVSYPDLKKNVPDYHYGPTTVLLTDKFMDSVKRATAVSPTKSIVLQLHGRSTLIKSWSTEEGGKGFRSELPSWPNDQAKETEPISVVLNGKMLGQCLSVAKTPKVRLCYVAPDQPIRIESGAYVEVLYPWRV